MDVAHNVALQRELYGASIGECVHRVADRLGLSQAAVARILGVSAPMLSQLSSGRRIKLGNPQAATRLSALLALVDEVDAGLAHDAVAERLQHIATAQVSTFTRPRAAGRPTEGSSVTAVLRAVASGRELVDAADRLAAAHPGLAELIRVYGTGSPDEVRHYHRSIAHLLPEPGSVEVAGGTTNGA